MDKKYYSRLPVKTVNNTRDLGGYPARDGTMTKYGVFVRGAGVSDISIEDMDFLYQYGIRAVIDLRNPKEGRENEPFVHDSRFCWENIPLLNGLTEEEKGLYTGKVTLADIYVALAEKAKEPIAAVIECINSKLSSGGVLFHCSAGKDRTGVISALLLLLAGVSELDIIANYMVSEIYIRPALEKVKKLEPNCPMTLFSSPASYIERFLMHINIKYGSAHDYLTDAGVRKSTLDFISSQFVV